MGWLITMLILVGISIIPLGVSVQYDAEGLFVSVIAGFIKFTIIPSKPKKEKTVQVKKTENSVPKKKPEAKTNSNVSAPKTDKKSGGNLKLLLPFVKIALDFLNDFRRKIRMDYLTIKLILAGGDPCDLAVNYGRAWAALGNLIPRLERVFVIKKRDINLECDFEASEICVIARADITITIGRLFSLAVVYGFRMLKEFLRIKKLKKAVPNYES